VTIVKRLSRNACWRLSQFIKKVHSKHDVRGMARMVY
jgi:hypothetical protein